MRLHACRIYISNMHHKLMAILLLSLLLSIFMDWVGVRFVIVVFMLSVLVSVSVWVRDSIHLVGGTFGGSLGMYSFLTLVYNGIRHVSHNIWFLRIGNGKRSAKLGVIGANLEIFRSRHLQHVFLSLRPSKRQTDRNSVRISCDATSPSAFSMGSSSSMVNVMKKKAIDREILTIFDLVIAENGFIKNK